MFGCELCLPRMVERAGGWVGRIGGSGPAKVLFNDKKNCSICVNSWCPHYEAFTC